MSKKQDIKLDNLVTVKPITDNQKVVFNAWRKENKNLFLFGVEQAKLLYHFTLH